jgi:hypothetical protein
VCRDVFRRGVETVRDRTISGLRPVAGEDVVGAAAKQEIEALSLRLGDGFSSRGTSIRCRPSAMRIVVAAFIPPAGALGSRRRARSVR